MTFDIGAFISDTNDSKSVEELVKRLEKHFHTLGIETFLISLLNDHPTFGLPARHGILRSYPEDWMKHYFEKKYEYIDPVRLECHNIGAFSWDELMKQNRFSFKQRRMMQEAGEAGLKHGVAVGVCSHNGQYAGVGFASTEDFGVTKNKISLLNLLAIQATQCFLQLSATRKKSSAATEAPLLTAHQHEVLKWIATGITAQAVADKLVVNKKTVDYHLENIYRRLGVTSRAQAISKSIQLGLVQAYPDLMEI